MSPKTELELQWTLMYTLGMLAWIATGYSAYSLAMCPCADHAVLTGLELGVALVMTWAVWPRRVVANV